MARGSENKGNEQTIKTKDFAYAMIRSLLWRMRNWDANSPVANAALGHIIIEAIHMYVSEL